MTKWAQVKLEKLNSHINKSISMLTAHFRTVWPWPLPYNFRITACQSATMNCIFIDFDVDNSSHFLFTQQTDRQTHRHTHTHSHKCNCSLNYIVAWLWLQQEITRHTSAGCSSFTASGFSCLTSAQQFPLTHSVLSSVSLVCGWSRRESSVSSTCTRSLLSAFIDDFISILHNQIDISNIKQNNLQNICDT